MAAVVLAAMVSAGPDGASARDLSRPPGDAGQESLNPMATVPRASLDAFVEEPLFDPTRRLPPPVVAPPYVPPPVVQAPPEPPPALHLLGVVGGADAIAVVRTPDGKTAYLRSGDRLGAWTVRVLPMGLRIRSGDRLFDYGLFTVPDRGAGPTAVDPRAVGSLDPVRAGGSASAPPALASRIGN